MLYSLGHTHHASCLLQSAYCSIELSGVKDFGRGKPQPLVHRRKMYCRAAVAYGVANPKWSRRL